VDIYLLPENVEVESGEAFIIDVMIEPNDQPVTAAQVVLKFDPDYLRVESSTLDPDSPLSTHLVPDDQFDNDAGTVVLSSGPYKSILAAPDYTFRLGTIIFDTRDVDKSTEIEFIREGDSSTFVGIEGVDVTNNLFEADVTISRPPTPTPEVPPPGA
jgi:hypothetical protein